MSKDPVIDRVREIRHAISKEFGHDPRKLIDYYRKRGERHRRHTQEQQEALTSESEQKTP